MMNLIKKTSLNLKGIVGNDEASSHQSMKEKRRSEEGYLPYFITLDILFKQIDDKLQYI